VFAGTGAIVIDNVTGGAVSHVGVALTFGLIVLAMIYTIGDISGAHINSAVTIGFFAARRFGAGCVLPYIASQCAGAFAASIVLRFSVSQKRDTWSDGAGRFRDAIVRTRDASNSIAHVRDPERFDRCSRKGNYSGHRDRCRHRSRGVVRRTDLWSINESCAFAGTGVSFRTSQRFVDLSCGASFRSSSRRDRVPLCAETRLLLGR
jgi:hypothetical protein